MCCTSGSKRSRPVDEALLGPVPLAAGVREEDDLFCGKGLQSVDVREPEPRAGIERLSDHEQLGVLGGSMTDGLVERLSGDRLGNERKDLSARDGAATSPAR
jgi:hypothetical protein